WLCNALKVKFGIIQVLLGLALWYCVFNSGIHATIAGVVFAFFVPDDKLAELELKMHNPVNFLILPLFALANTAIPLNIGMVHNLGSTLSLGIILGLFIGKPLGIFFACWLLVRKGVAIMPRGIGWNHLIGAGVLAGIGFTMSIFIACLAFSSREVQDVAKLAILLAAVISVAASFIWFYWRVPAKMVVKSPILKK
ncbi:MAG TPA: Na+/H+ antiporter NhaA, partial [Phnomibacter sp.]|nr:Na+/H+ antiporter NhaA [Phnomibacter sp.]